MERGRPRRIVIAAGGTAGHVVPALAVADALRADGATVEFVGAGRAERELVPAAGYELHEIRVEGLSRSSLPRAAIASGRALAALPRARRLLAKIRPDAVMGAGGYVAGPVGAAALSLRIPLVLTEADSHLGLANRVLAPFATRICLALPLAGRDGGRYMVTGRPIPAAAADRELSRERFGVDRDEDLVVVFGGSLGARSINLAAAQAFAGAPFRVLHVAGRRDYPELASRELGAGYDLREYLDVADFTAALAAADLVVARAGGSIFEIAAQGRPAILIPYPHASGDHQRANAAWMERAGAARVIADADLSPGRLGTEVAALLADRERLVAMGAAAADVARPRAAADVAAEILRAAAR